jgi:dienelactone hydrolase
VFEEISFSSTEPEMFMVDAVDYEDTISDVQLRGYLAIPDESWQRPLPGVVLVPDWDGANTYEKKRATMLAEQGYVAMVADIFGADKQENLTIPERIEETTFYNSNPDVFLRRMQLAIDQLKGVEDVNGEAVSLAGYCFGGAGILLYAASGSSDVKVCTAFHGSFGSLPPYTDDINTYVQIFAGGNDGLHGDPTVLEAYLDNRTETTGGWEITRYAGLGHGFTSVSKQYFDFLDCIK